MQLSIRNVSIIASLVISGAMIGGAFWLSGPATSTASAESAEELLRAYAALDTDADGLTDWQEAIYGTDPEDAESVEEGMSDADAVAQGRVQPKFVAEEAAPIEVPSGTGSEAPEDNTLTAQFARDFFGDYLSGRSVTPPSSEDIAAFVEDKLAELSASRGARFSADDISISRGGEEAVRAYVAAVERVFDTYEPGLPESELVYFSDAVLKADAQALRNVERIASAYNRIAEAFVSVPVPAETASAHLRTALALSSLGAVIADMAMFKEDPLRGFIGMRSYQETGTELSAALAKLGASFPSTDIEPGSPGSSFYALVKSLATE